MCGGFHNADDGSVNHDIKFSSDVLRTYLRKLYGADFDYSTDIEPTAWREVLRIINEATIDGLAQAQQPPTPEDHFYEQLRHSNEVFAAFKVHSMSQQLGDRLLDSNGKLKPFNKWLDEVKPIASHYVGPWLRTEYNTAVARAHYAADWKTFEANSDIFPNLQWMPTTSPNPDTEHRIFWENKLTRPIDDPFWDKHHPGDRWNCKCTLEPTDEPVTDIPKPEDREKAKPAQGLKGNPAKTGQLFDKSHPYFPKNCKQCAFNKKKGSITKNLSKIFVNHKGGCFNCPYMDDCIELAKNDGFVVKNKYNNGGELLIHPKVERNKSDYHKIVELGQFFAKQGNVVKIPPRIHYKSEEYKNIYKELIGTKYERKCPDLKVGNTFYEFESFERPWNRNKIKRMISHGVIQSPYIIIDNSAGCSDRFILKNIYCRLNKNANIQEVWTYEKGKVRLLFKNKKTGK